jgi:hypothetical protein
MECRVRSAAGYHYPFMRNLRMHDLGSMQDIVLESNSFFSLNNSQDDGNQGNHQ